MKKEKKKEKKKKEKKEKEEKGRGPVAGVAVLTAASRRFRSLKYKASRRWTRHAPNGQNHQTDYTLVRRRYKSGVNRKKTRTFPAADVGSDPDLVMTSFRVRLRNQQTSRLRYDLEKLKHPGEVNL
ncbi:hypothetical protein ACOMHN_013954 [Nucella lapillus]